MSTGTAGERFNPLDSAALRPSLAEARTNEPVFFNPMFQCWVVTRQADVVNALLNPGVFSSQGMFDMRSILAPDVADYLYDNGFVGGTLIEEDPPDHTRLRRALSQAFTPSRTAAMESAIRATANQLIDGFADAGQADLLPAFAMPLPLTVVMGLIGVPIEQRQNCMDWCKDMASLGWVALRGGDVNEQMALAKSTIALTDYFRELITERENEPADDLISALIALRKTEPESFADDELVAMFPGLLLAGHETTAFLISSTVRLLLAHGKWTATNTRPRRIEAAIEESLRFESPIIGFPRIVTRDTEIAGVRISAGERIFLSNYSANHDECVYERPHQFDIAPDSPPKHVAFGWGIHFCIGAPLARLEARIALELLCQRLPGLTLVDSTPTYIESSHFRGLAQLNVRWQTTPRSRVRRFRERTR